MLGAMVFPKKTIASSVYQLEDIDIRNNSSNPKPKVMVKQKQLRVLIKKLPKDVLDKHFANMDKQTGTSPSRISKRIKIVPEKYKYFSQTQFKYRPGLERKLSENATNKSKNTIQLSKSSITNSNGNPKLGSQLNKTNETPRTEPTKVFPIILNSERYKYYLHKPFESNRTGLETKSSSSPIVVTEKHKTLNQTENKTMGISKKSIIISKANPQLKMQLTKANKILNISPQTEPAKNDPVILKSSNILVIKQPVLKNDPLDIPTAEETISTEAINQISNLENDLDAETDKETDYETDTEQNVENQVTKQIFYTSKSVQTKFTCNDSICGLVDSDGFNLNCFYCYEIFPLHKWLEFKNHVKIRHHLEEKETPEFMDISKDDEQESDANKCLPNKQKISTVNVTSTSTLNKNVTTPIINDNKIIQTPTQQKQINNIPLIKLIPQKQTNIIKLNQTEFSRAVPYRNLLNQSNLSITKSIDREKLPPKKPTLNEKLDESDEFINLSSNGFSSMEDLSSSYVDEIISIGDDEKNDEELDDILQNLSQDLQKKNIKIKKIPPNQATTVHSKSNMDKTAKSNEVWSPPYRKFPNLPKLPAQITIKQLDTTSKETTNTPATFPVITSNLKKAYIKLPSNLNIKEVLKTIPKPTTSQQNPSDIGSKNPRYFVVKKVAKPTATENAPNINFYKNSKNTKILPKTKDSSDDDDDMPSNDENEDEVPKPTNGCGILFGLTNRKIVIEFLLKLKTSPELWRPEFKNDSSISYDESVRRLCKHINDRFDLDIQKFEMRLSIQRVKKWYCGVLQDIHTYKQNPNNTEPYRHTFMVYFKILNQFPTSDLDYTKNLLFGKRFQLANTSTNDNPKPDRAMHKVAKMYLEDMTKQPKPVKENKSIITFKSKKEDASQNLIEFDADAMYEEDESSEDDSFSKSYYKKKRTIVYRPVEPIICEICGRNFKRNIDLRRHRVGHFPPQFQCSLCNKMFLHKHWAERCSHERKKRRNSFRDTEISSAITKVESKFSSSDITKVQSKFSTLSNYRRKYICEMCGASYNSQGSLNTHKRDKHLNQRYKCIVCKFTAVTNYRISQHQKKRHVVEPGTVEEIAKRVRSRTDSKTKFTPEARKEFEWRREMKKKVTPGEMFYGCVKCRIVFQTRKEKLLHNKMEHPIKDTTVICLMCLPEKMLLCNSNSVRRHYSIMHKVPWDEIDDLVKRTKPVTRLLSREEVDLLNCTENYSELLNELLNRKNIQLDTDSIKEETTKSVVDIVSNQLNIVKYSNGEENSQKNNEDVCVDGIIDHDYNNDTYIEEDERDNRYDSDEEEVDNEYNDNSNNAEDLAQIEYQINEQQHGHTIVYEGELVEESIVEEEFGEEDIVEEQIITEYF